MRLLKKIFTVTLTYKLPMSYKTICNKHRFISDISEIKCINLKVSMIKTNVFL